MEDNQTDVTVAEAVETAPESSPEEQTGQVETQEQTNVSTEAAQTVPYERFKEVNDKYKTLEQKMAEVEARLAPAPDQQSEAVKQQLKALGFVSNEEIEARIRQEREDTRVEQELSSLESRYSGSDGRPKFDRRKVVEFALNHGIANPEVAYKAMHERELLDWHVKNAITKTAGVKTEGSDGSGSTQVGTTNEDLKTAIAKGDKSALHTFLKRINS